MTKERQYTLFPTSIRRDVVTAFREFDSQPTFEEVRTAILVDRDPRFVPGRPYLTSTHYVNPGIERRLQAGHFGIGKDSFDRDVTVDLSELPKEAIRAKGILTYQTSRMEVSQSEVFVVPDAGSFKLSPQAPATSAACVYRPNGTFDADTRGSSREEIVNPLWVNRNPSAGGIAAYTDGEQNGAQAYYLYDYVGYVVIKAASSEEIMRIIRLLRESSVEDGKLEQFMRGLRLSMGSEFPKRIA